MHLCSLFCLLLNESLVCFPLERKSGEVPCRYHVLLTKRSHVASSPSVWIDKDFWFNLPFSPRLPSLTSFPPSLLFHSVYFWHRKTRRERAREGHCEKKKNGRRAQERERDSFGVKGEVLVSSSLLLSDWPLVWSLNLGPSQRGRAMCHFAGGAGRGGAGAGGRRAGCGADAAGRGKGRGFGYGGADESSARVLAHVEQGGVVEEEGGGQAPSLAPRGPKHHLAAPLKTGKRQLATTGC